MRHLCCPMELAKTRLQLQERLGPARTSPGPWTAWRRSTGRRSLRGVNRGAWRHAAARDPQPPASYFLTYDGTDTRTGL